MYKKCFFLSLMILPFSSSSIFSQNLVPNHGFENHGELICIGCHSREDFPALVPGWENLGGHAQLFTTDYDFRNSETEHGFNWEKYTPLQGKATVELHYVTKGCGTPVGGGEYLQAKLKRPLRKHQYYSIEFGIKVLETAGLSKYPAFPENFGVSFSNRPFRINYGTNLIINDTPFRVSDFVTGEWIRVNHIIRPTKDLDYLIIGTFLDWYRPYSFADNTGSEFKFLIDEIRVKQLTSPDSLTIRKAIDYPYLRRRPAPPVTFQRRERIDKLIHFDFGSHELTTEARVMLDTIAVALNEDPHIMLEIEGHTDSIGSQNKQLSLRRARAVKNYLIHKGNVQAFRFKILGKGSSEAVAENTTEEGRQLNRRVQIRQSGNTLSQHLYSTASQFALDDQADSAFHYLRLWQQTNPGDQIIALADPELRSLHPHKQWKGFRFFMEQRYEGYPRPRLAFSLDLMYYKSNLPDLGKNLLEAKGYIPEALREFNTGDTASIRSIRKILDEQGWPKRAEVGDRPACAPLYVLMHSQDKGLMRKYLGLVKKAFTENQIPAHDFAVYVDQLLILEKGKRR